MGLIDNPVGVLGLALLIELVIGDPVTRWHPVALFGRASSLFVDAAPIGRKQMQLVYGALLVGAGAGFVFVIGALGLQTLTSMSPAAAVIVGAAVLKVSFSVRMLVREAARAADLLEHQGVAASHGPLTALVSRDLDGISPRLASSAAVESLAENLSDSFVAPLFYYAVLGVPGALAYRAINTLDAMIGYHGRFEYLGRATAKLDDIVNFAPARLTAVLVVIAAGLARANPGRAVEIGRRDHAQTESPNAGWPMAAMAGALGTELEKLGHYHLGAPADDPDPSTIRRAIPIVRWSAALACLLTAGGLMARSL
jgi:adenosylcobinamide-phosphate synthase